MKLKKETILRFLKKNGRSSTSKIATRIKAGFWLTERYLGALKDEGLVKVDKETKATYWDLK